MRALQAIAAGLLSPFGAGFPAGALLGGEPQGAAFDFLNMDMVIRGGGLDWQGDPNSKLTYTSPPTKWVRNASGIYVSGTTLRTDYLANGTALGLLVEGQFTNVLLRSQEFDNAAWTKTDTTVTANATTSPDGTANADLLTEGTAGTAATRQIGTATSASVPVNGSIFLKASANITWALIILWDGSGGSGVRVWVNLSTGVIGTVTALGTATSTGGQVVAAANGFYRVELWATFPAAVSDIRLDVLSASADNSTTRVNNAAYYAWQASAGLGARPSSPVVTTTAAVTRAADNISILLSLLPFDATKGTLLAKFIPADIASAATHNVANLYESAGNDISFFHTSTRRFLARVASATQAQLAGNAPVYGAVSKQAASWKANDFAASFDGGTIQTDTSGSLPTPTLLSLGSQNGVSHLGGWLQQLIYLPRDMSDSELVAWSTL